MLDWPEILEGTKIRGGSKEAIRNDLGNFRQHISASGLTGVTIAWAAHLLAGMHWLYGTVAALLATISGLLPDLDHPIGVQMRGLTGTLGVLTGLAVWHHLGKNAPGLPFEVHLWAVVLAYFFVRYGLRHLLVRLMVHRGVSHSLPACGVWGALTYLYYPSPYHVVRVWMASAVVMGFLSHLILDEACSVDLSGARIKRSFGTALKLWAPSASATLAIYAILFLLVRQIIDVWPEGPMMETFTESPPKPPLPSLESFWSSLEPPTVGPPPPWQLPRGP